MTFLHASLAIAGFACVAIPVLIHLLFRRRRKPVRFGAMRFLIEALKKQRRRLRLEQLLLLLARCLAVACLAAALGRPALEAAGLLGAGSGRTLYILLDNSLASGAADGAAAGGATPTVALGRLKAKALALLEALGPSDRAALVTLGAPADARVLPPSTDLGAIRSMIERLEPTDAATDWPSAFRAVGEDLERPPSAGAPRASSPVVVALSDFTLGAADTGAPLARIAGPTGAAGVRLFATRPNAAPPGNVQALSVDPLRSLALTGALGAEGGAGEAQVVRVSLRRTGPVVAEAGVTTVRVRALPSGAGAPVARASVRWAAGQSEAVASLQLDPAMLAGAGERALVAEIDQDALGADNAVRRPLPVRETLKVGLVDRRRFGTGLRADRMTAGEWLRLALRPGAGGSAIETIDLEPAAIDAAALAPLDAVCVARPDLLEDDAWARLRRFADAGGLVFVMPPSETSVHVWTDAFVKAMGLGWTIAREATALDAGASFADEQPASPLLALIRDELPDLLKPVGVSRALRIEQSTPATRTLLALRSGGAWLAAAAPGAGEARTDATGAAPEAGLVLYMASPPELTWTDLPAKPLMVPLMHELVRQGAGQAASAWAQIAGAPVRAPARAVSLVDIAAAGPDRAPLPVGESGRTPEPVRSAALFRAVDDRGLTRGLAVNPDTGAGRTDAQPASVIGAWLGRAVGVEPGGAGDDSSGPVVWLDDEDPAAPLRARQQDASLSLPLLIGALVLLLLETLLARLFSHAAVATAAAPAGGARHAPRLGDALETASEAA